jgi:hypothetical protein
VKSSLKMKFKDEKELKSIPEGVEEMWFSIINNTNRKDEVMPHMMEEEVNDLRNIGSFMT